MTSLVWLTKMYEPLHTAHDFARRAHFGQTRKGSKQTPYIRHCEEVAHLVWLADGNPDLMACALLHDVPEDSGFTLEDIREKFGDGIYHILFWLTDPLSFDVLSTLDRKSQQVIRLKSAPTSAKLIKLADQISNLRSMASDPPVNWSREKRFSYIVGVFYVIRECRSASEFLYEESLKAYMDACKVTAQTPITA